MSRRFPALLLPLLLTYSCAGIQTSAIDKQYDFSRIRRVGVLEFDSGSAPNLGAEDLTVKYLLNHGYPVVERSKLNALLKEQKYGAMGVFLPETAKKIGKLLGVDALVLGRVTTYQASRKEVVMVKSVYTWRVPVYETRLKRVEGKHAPSARGKGKKGHQHLIEVKEQIGTDIREEVRNYPQVIAIDAVVGMVVKLVDVESGQIIWVGSFTGEGVTDMIAAESVISHLIRKLKKSWPPGKHPQKRVGL